MDGKAVGTAQELRGEIRGKPVGQPVLLEVFRPGNGGQGSALKLKVSPGEWVQPETTLVSVKKTPAPNGNAGVELGVTVRPLTPEVAGQLGTDMTEGVVVVSVEKNSPAAAKGIKPGDIITGINQQAVKSPGEFREVSKQADLKKGVLINLVSGNTARFEILKQNEP